MAAPVFVMMFLTFPETSSGNILLRRARRLRALTSNPLLQAQSEIDQGSKTLNAIIVESLWRPIVICMRDPAVLFTNLYTSFIYGIYYSYFEAFPLVYIGIYGFNLGEMGTTFICIVVGAVIGIVIYVSYVWFYLEPDILAHGLRAQEHRLVPALIAVVALPVGLFIFAWTARADIHWIVSIIGITIFAIGAFILYALPPFPAVNSTPLMLPSQLPVYIHVPTPKLPTVCRLTLRRKRRVPLGPRRRQHHLRSSALRQPRHRQRRLDPRRPRRRRLPRDLVAVLLRREAQGQE